MTQPSIDDAARIADLEARISQLENGWGRATQHGLQDLVNTPGAMRFGGNKQRFDAWGREAIVGVDTASKYFYDFMVSAFLNDPANALPLLAAGAFINPGVSEQWDMNAYMSAGNYSRVFVNAAVTGTVQIAGSEITRSSKVAQGYAYADGTYTDGHFFVKPALFLSGLSAAPTGVADGYIWYDSTANKLYARINGVTTELGASAGLTITNQTTAYNAAVSDFVRCSGTFTVTLPTTPAANSVIRVYNVGTGLVTVARGGSDTIFYYASGQTSVGILPGESYDFTYYSTGTEWEVS